MQMRRKLLVAPMAVAVAAVAVGSAFGATAKAPKVDHITIKSGISVKPGYSITDKLRYSPYVSAVRSGGTVSIKGGKGAFSEGPHSFSLVKKSQLPKTGAQVNNCKVCGQLAQEHGFDPNSNNPPSKPFVDGGDGFNKAGDSVIFEKNPAALKISAKKGTTLYYLCAFHPWMQGSIKVK
jgi:hypothetical protein